MSAIVRSERCRFVVAAQHSSLACLKLIFIFSYECYRLNQSAPTQLDVMKLDAGSADRLDIPECSSITRVLVPR